MARSPTDYLAVGRFLELLRLAGVLQLRERPRLDLAHALARDADLGADRLERPRLPRGQAVAQLDHAALAPLELLQRVLEVHRAQVVRDLLERSVVKLVLDEVGQTRVGAVAGADGGLERNRLAAELEDLLDLVGGHLDLGGDLLRRGLAAV